jgi:aquaporin related protein
MVLVGGLHPLRALFTAIAQLAGGIVAAVIIKYLLPGAFSVQTVLTSGTSVVRGLFIEMVCTSMLVRSWLFVMRFRSRHLTNSKLFTILMLAAEKHKATFIAPIGIGLSMFICELVGVFYTGGSLNPIRSFGPAVVEGNFVHYHWIYWV